MTVTIMIDFFTSVLLPSLYMTLSSRWLFLEELDDPKTLEFSLFHDSPSCGPDTWFLSSYVADKVAPADETQTPPCQGLP